MIAQAEEQIMETKLMVCPKRITGNASLQKIISGTALLLLILGVISCFAHTGAFAASSRVSLSNELFVEEIEKDVFVVTHNFPWPANALLVKVSPTDLVLIDTPYTPEATGILLEWVKQKFGECKIVAVNTGYHIDNLGGNEYLLKQQIPIYGSDLTVAALGEKAEKTRAALMAMLASPGYKRYYDVYKSMEFKKPDHVFKATDGLVLKFGDETLEVYYPGPSHAPDNLVVFLNKRKILFGGCMVKSLESKDLGFTEDANFGDWLKSVQAVQKRFATSRVVIPGHGAWGNGSLLIHTVELLKR